MVLTDSNDDSYPINNPFCYFNNEDQLICEDCQPFFGYFSSYDVIDGFNICNYSEDIIQSSLDNLSIETFDVSIGDLDSDGLDEIIWTSNG